MISQALRRARDGTISLVVVLAVFLVCFSNCRGFMTDFVIRPWFPQTPAGQHLLHRALWTIHYTGYNLGLDSQWVMFSTLHRFDWRTHVIATDAAGQERPVELPLRDDGPWWRERLAFKTGKFELNLYADAFGRLLIANAACKQLKQQGVDARSVRFDVAFRNINPPETAKATGTTSGNEGLFKLGQVECP